MTDEDRSIASGRGMEEIAAGTGQAPKPFMSVADAPAPAADAVWDSRAGLVTPPAPKRVKAAKRMRDARLPRAAACDLGGTPTGWAWLGT